MKDVLVFFNSQPVEVVRTLKAVSTIRRQYPDGREEHLKIKRAGLLNVTNQRSEIFVASDKELLPDEVIQAAKKYLSNNNKLREKRSAERMRGMDKFTFR